MKYAAYGLMAAFLALGVYGAVPTTAEGWYTPSGGFSRQSGSGTVWYLDDEGNEQSVSVSVDGQGKVTGGMGTIADTTLKTSYEALVKACANEAWNALQDEAIQTIGKNLHELTSKDGIHIRNENTGQEFTIKFGGSLATAVSGSSGEIPATSNAEDPADNASLGWRNDGKLELKGWQLSDSQTSLWDYPYGAVAVRLSPNDRTGLHYFPWHGIDRLSLAPNDSTHKLELSGWRTAGADVMTPLAEAITKAEADKGVFDRYELVVRNSDRGLNYVALGTLNIGGVAVDGVSITTNTTDGATTQGDASLYGWADADAESIPQKGDGRLKWTDPADMVDGISIGMTDAEGGGKVWEVKGFADAGACRASVSAMLSDPDGSDATTHLLLAKKTDTGELHYVPMGRGVQSGAAVDDTTITTNTAHGAVTMGEASIYGWSSAANDTYLSKNEGGTLEWRKVPGGTPDGVSITTNSVDGAVTDGAMSIRGFSTAEDGTTPVKKNNSIVWSKAASAIEAGSGITITTNSTSQVVSHNLVAGAGISITPASSGTAVTIASATPSSATVVDPHAQELTFLTELWYDSETHQIKGRRITAKVMFVGTVPTAQEFVAVQCTPHSAEHESEGESESGSN